MWTGSFSNRTWLSGSSRSSGVCSGSFSSFPSFANWASSRLKALSSASLLPDSRQIQTAESPASSRLTVSLRTGESTCALKPASEVLSSSVPDQSGAADPVKGGGIRRILGSSVSFCFSSRLSSSGGGAASRSTVTSSTLALFFPSLRSKVSMSFFCSSLRLPRYRTRAWNVSGCQRSRA